MKLPLNLLFLAYLAASCCAADSDYLVFPTEVLSGDANSPVLDVPASTPVGLCFGATQGVAWWADEFRMVGANGEPTDALGARKLLAKPSGALRVHGDAWVSPYLFSGAGGQSVRVQKIATDGSLSFVEVNAATPQTLSPPVLDADANWALVVWGRSPGTTPAQVEGRWMSAGQPVGSGFFLTLGFLTTTVRCDGDWLVLSQQGSTVRGRWLAPPPAIASPEFIFATNIPETARPVIVPMSGGALVSWSQLNASTGRPELWAQHVSKSGTLGPRLLYGPTPTGGAELNRATSLQLFVQADGSVRCTWLQGALTLPSHWKTLTLRQAAASPPGTLEALFDAPGQAVPYTETQTFTAASGPLGNVTVFLRNQSPQTSVVSHLGLPLYPIGPEWVLSGSAATQSPAVCPLADGYAQIWLNGDSSVWVRRLDANGLPIWPAAIKVSGDATNLRTPAIAAGPEGLLVGWLDTGGIRVSRLDFDGNILSEPTYLDAHGYDEFRALRLTYCDGKFLGVWRESDGIAFRWMLPSGEFSSGVVFPANALATSPQVASNGNQALIIGKPLDNELRGAIVGGAAPTNGTALSSIISTPDSQEIETPSVAWSQAANAWLIAWIDDRSPQPSRLYTRRVGADGAFLDANAVLLEEDTHFDSPAKLVVSAAPGGWWLGVVQTLPNNTSSGLVGWCLGANGLAINKRSLAETPLQHWSTEALVATLGPTGGVLLAGELQAQPLASQRLLFPSEIVPALTMHNHTLSWQPTPHFPSQAACIYASLDLKHWEPLTNAAQTTPGTFALPTGENRCFFRLQAGR